MAMVVNDALLLHEWYFDTTSLFTTQTAVHVITSSDPTLSQHEYEHPLPIDASRHRPARHPSQAEKDLEQACMYLGGSFG